MKPIIVDMQDMSDSTEVYESRPNPFMIWFIYLLVAILVVALGWMYFSKIDIVVKSNGIFRSDEAAFDVSSSVSGVVTECNITEGQYVNTGDVLFSIGADALEETIAGYEEILGDTKQRIDILNAYNVYLDGDEAAFTACVDNKYYDEFAGRKDLLELSIKSGDIDSQTQKDKYQYEINNATQVINGYNNQLAKLEQTKECVKSRVNTFSAEDSYYGSIVETYLLSYNATIADYDAKVAVYQETPDETAVIKLRDEQILALQNLETKQLATIEQQIQTVKGSLDSAVSSQSLLQAQLDLLYNADSKNTSESMVLSEKKSVAAELLSYESKKTECENALKQYDLESANATVKAQTSGYICLNQEMYVGSYITQGSNICRILPENSSGYYAEIYVANADIAKLSLGQEVKFEIAAYPSSEYGYFTGSVDSISKDIKVDQASGSAYYLVKVRCDGTTVTNKEGKKGSIMNGMACQAKVVVDEENVLMYCLRKIELVD